jgi:hypothetical protein
LKFTFSNFYSSGLARYTTIPNNTRAHDRMSQPLNSLCKWEEEEAEEEHESEQKGKPEKEGQGADL